MILINACVLFYKPQLSFSKDATIPGKEDAVIENKAVSEAVLETMIGEPAVSPALKLSLASRLPDLFIQGTIII